MTDYAISDGLELVTDLNIIRMFPSADDVTKKQQAFSFMSEKKTVTPFYSKAREQLGILTCLKRKNFAVFDENGSVNPQPRCEWRQSDLARFISVYIRVFKQPVSDRRTFILEQLESEAKEHNVILPKPSEMQRRKPKSRFSCEIVDHDVPSSTAEYKAYYDGENIVAYMPGENKVAERVVYERTEWDNLFDKEYDMLKNSVEYTEKGKAKEEKALCRRNLEMELIERFYKVYEYDDSAEKESCAEFIHRKIYNLSAAYAERKKRFHRKKDQVRWTYWITVTYDDKKFESEQAFKKTLLTRFRNLCDPKRNDWLVMGVFERGELNGRLHFHGFCYVPQGKDVGEYVRRAKYSEKEKCWHNYIANTDFEEKFGDNEFEDITAATQKNVNAMAKYTDKMLGYMEKGGIVYYCRHIPTEFLVKLETKDLLTAFSITCKRSIKRYVVSDIALKRTDLTIERRNKLTQHDDPYDIGLLDDAT